MNDFLYGREERRFFLKRDIFEDILKSESTIYVIFYRYKFWQSHESGNML